MHFYYVQWHGKGTFRAEATLNIKNINPVALAIVELCKPEGISQVVS